jgi:hypothetical protein
MAAAPHCWQTTPAATGGAATGAEIVGAPTGWIGGAATGAEIVGAPAA